LQSLWRTCQIEIARESARRDGSLKEFEAMLQAEKRNAPGKDHASADVARAKRDRAAR
jgi:hypothetical protein